MKKQGKETALLFTATVDGDLPSMKNQRRLFTNRRTGRPISVKSEKAMDYENRFLTLIKPKVKGSYGGPVSVKARVWFSSRRNDLDIEFLKDLIQRAGIIENDRQVVHMEAWKGLDKDCPRVVFSVYGAQDVV